MQFGAKLSEGIFRKRRSRFLADIEFGGELITAHLPNTGSLRGCNVPGSLCRFSSNDDPARKLKHTLEMIQANNQTWVGVNTATPNKITKQALAAGLLAHWENHDELKPECKITNETRFDFRLKFGDRHHYVEVKSVTMVEKGRAMFPDSVTERGQKHLRELSRLASEGHSTELVFAIQRDDATEFGPAEHIDPEYARLFSEAVKAGVRITPLVVHLSEDEIRLTDCLLPVFEESSRSSADAKKLKR